MAVFLGEVQTLAPPMVFISWVGWGVCPSTRGAFQRGEIERDKVNQKTLVRKEKIRGMHTLGGYRPKMHISFIPERN